MPPRTLNIILLAIILAAMCEHVHRKSRRARLVGDAMNLIDQYYVEPVDDKELLYSAMDGMTGKLDQHSEFIPGEAYENFQDSINQEFAGIGILVEQPEPDQPVRVITPLVGSPALAAGMRPEDEIIRVEDEDVSAMELSEVSSRLKGPIGTIVRVVVRREDSKGSAEKSIKIQRDTIELESVIGDHRGSENQWVYRLKDDPRIGYLRLTSFGEKTTNEVAKVLKSLDNDFDGLVIDVRGNGGGLLESAVAICDMFLDSGRIVSTKIRGGVIESAFDATSGTLVAKNRPIAILIDGGSASASEILAACLQDNGRAEVVGTRSYGKGTVQNILPLQFGRSALKLTVARYYRPSDRNIHRGRDDTDDDEWGVTPKAGFVVELDESTMEELVQKWRQASYPLIKSAEQRPDSEPADAGSESGESGEDGDSPSKSKKSGLEIDLQLKRAVEFLREDAGAQVTTAAAA